MMVSSRLLESCSFSSRPGREVAGRTYKFRSSVTNNSSFIFFYKFIYIHIIYPRVLNAVSHDLFPVFVNSFKESPFFGDLLHDVL